MAKKPSAKMLQFVETERDMPAKRDSAVRKDDFLEIYGDYIDVKAEEQASAVLNAACLFAKITARWTIISRLAETNR